MENFCLADTSRFFGQRGSLEMLHNPHHLTASPHTHARAAAHAHCPHTAAPGGAPNTALHTSSFGTASFTVTCAPSRTWSGPGMQLCSPYKQECVQKNEVVPCLAPARHVDYSLFHRAQNTRGWLPAVGNITQSLAGPPAGLDLFGVALWVSDGSLVSGPGAAAKCFWGEGALPSHGLPPPLQTPPRKRGDEIGGGGGKNIFKEKRILMAKAKGNFWLLTHKRPGKRVYTDASEGGSEGGGGV